MASRANISSVDQADAATGAFDDLDAAWDDMPQSTAFPVRSAVSGIVLPKSVTLSAKSAIDELDEPTLEIGESFADDVELDMAENDEVLEVRDEELFDARTRAGVGRTGLRR